MKTTLLHLSSFILVFSSPLVAQTFQSGLAATALIELYTSEGCSSCPPAERWLSELKTNKALWTEFVPVAFHITYWDDLGWPDAYANPSFTQRQRDYAFDWNSRNIYTPEFVYQGREWHLGDSPPPASLPGVLTIKRNPDGGGTLTFKPAATPSSSKTYDASVALLGSDILVNVRAGENAGRALPHDFVALHLARVRLTLADDGAYTGSFASPTAHLPPAGKHALAAWVSRPGDLTPLQATGGWIDSP